MNNQIIYEEKHSYIEINRFLYTTYSWMMLGIMITALTAMVVSNSQTLLGMIYNNKILFFALIFGELGLVMYLSASLSKISYTKAYTLFTLYSALNGLTLSYIFIVYTASSIASTFFATSLTFGVMALYGYFTKTDLTKFGNILFMGLIGMIIASLVNMFFKNSGLGMVITYFGILLFCALVAYDSQYLKKLATSVDTQDESYKKLAIFGALKLYLDFINLFLLLLRLLGNRRN